MRTSLVLLLLSCIFCINAETFSIQPDGKHCQILLDNELLVEKVISGLDHDASYTIDHSDTVLPDGRRVYNVWSTDPRLQFRMELDVAPDGSQVEITTKTEQPAYFQYPNAPYQLSLKIPAAVLGEKCSFVGYQGPSRSVKKLEGTLGDGGTLPKFQWRYFCLKTAKHELLFDSNPIGAGEWCSIYGKGIIRGTVIIEGDTDKGLTITFPNGLDAFGGMTAAKVRIKLGNMSDYTKDHALMYLQYNEPLAHDALYSFGSTVHGQKYTAADLQTYTAERGFGWLEPKDYKVTNTHKGAYYSNISGQNGTFRLGKARSGLHLITVGAGNPTGIANRFSVTVNGQTLLSDRTIAANTVVTATLPLWVKDSTIDIQFAGSFVLSSLADQFLMADAEDYSIRRGFWRVDGVETSVLFRNADYLPYRYAFDPTVMEMPLPVPGKETAEPLKALSVPHYPFDYSAPENSWLYNLKLTNAGGNSATMNELLAPEAMERFMQETAAQKRTAIMLSGLHARHVYTGDHQRVFDYIKRFCEAAHRHGLKVIDHHDVTLLWNTDAGFRRLAERIDEVNRSLDTQLPGTQLCPFNPKMLATYKDYLRHIVEAGVDGLQIDELCIFYHAGSCEHCRRAFHEDTGWYLPFDETSSWTGDFSSDLTKVWVNWKIEKQLKLKTELIQEMRKINPNLITTNYGTLNNFIDQWGLRGWNSDQMKVGQHANVMGHECIHKNPITNARAFITGQKLYNFFRYNNNIPIYTWLYTETWDSSYFGYAVCNMNAQLPLFYASGTKVRPEGASDFIAFDGSAANMSLRTASPLAAVALLFSDQSRNWDSEPPPAPAILGTAQTMEEMHVPYQFIGEDTLNEQKLKPFQVILLGTSSCLSDAQLAELERYAERGGRVVMDFGALSRNEWGNLRKQWPLAGRFGFSFQKNAVEPIKIIGADIHGKQVMFNEEITYQLPKGITQEASSPIRLIGKDGKRYRASYEVACGKGAFVVLPAAMAVRSYCADLVYSNKYIHNPKVAETFAAILTEQCGPAANLLQTDAPAKIYTTLYQDGQTTFLHLLNGLGSGIEATKPTADTTPKPLFPPLEKDLHFTVPASGATKVYAVSPDFAGQKPLEFTQSSPTTISFVLPKQYLKVYTVIHIQ